METHEESAKVDVQSERSSHPLPWEITMTTHPSAGDS